VSLIVGIVVPESSVSDEGEVGNLLPGFERGEGTDSLCSVLPPFGGTPGGKKLLIGFYNYLMAMGFVKNNGS
jgi:hypothetical protein